MVLTTVPTTALPVLAAGESTEQSVEVEPTTSTEPIVEEVKKSENLDNKIPTDEQTNLDGVQSSAGGVISSGTVSAGTDGGTSPAPSQPATQQDSQSQEPPADPEVPETNDLTALINGAYEAAGKLNEAVSNLNVEDEESINAVYFAMDEAQSAMEKLQAALDDGASDEDSAAIAEAIDAVEAAINAAGTAWENLSGETATTLDEAPVMKYSVTIKDFDALREIASISVTKKPSGGLAAPVENLNEDGGVISDVLSTDEVVVTLTAHDGVKFTTANVKGKIAGGSDIASGGTATAPTITINSTTNTGAKDVEIEAYNAAEYYYDLQVTDDTGKTNSKIKGIVLDASLTGEGGAAQGIVTPGAVLNASATGTAKQIKNKEPQDLKFTLGLDNAATIPADYRAKVSYKINDSAEQINIPAVKEKVGNTEATVDTYTIPASVLENDCHKIVIVLESEQKKTMTINDNSDIMLSLKRAEPAANGDVWDTATALDSPNTEGKAFVGETFEFKIALAEAAANKKEITKVTKNVNNTGEVELTGSSDGVYSLTVEAGSAVNNTEIKIYTTPLASQYKTLSFALTNGSKAASATAQITKVIYSDGSNNQTATAYTDWKMFVVDAPDTEPTLGAADNPTALKILSASGDNMITSVEVTVTPGADYALNTVSGGTPADGAGGAKTCTFTYADVTSMDIQVSTKAKPIAADKFVNVSLDTTNDTTSNHLQNLSKLTGTPADKVKGVKADGTDAVAGDVIAAYKVLADAEELSFTVAADAGYELDQTSTNLAGMLKDIESETDDTGKTTYIVTLFAAKAVGTFAAGSNGADGTFTLGNSDIKLKQKATYYTAEIGLAGEDVADYSVGYEVSSDGTTDDDKAVVKDAAGNNIASGVSIQTTGAVSDPTSSDIPYNAQSFATTVSAATGYRLNSVSYTVGGGEATTLTPDATGEVDIKIANIKGNIKIVVDVTKGGYQLKDLAEKNSYTAYAGTLTKDVANSSVNYQVWNNVYYKGAYKVALVESNGSTPVPAAKDVTATVKNGDEIINLGSRNLADANTILIDLSKAKVDISDAVLTVEMKFKEEVIGTYVLNTSKKSTPITISGYRNAKVDQRVDTVVKYPVAMSGELGSVTTTYANADTTHQFIQSATVDSENNLVVTLKPMAEAKITKTAAVPAAGETPAKAAVYDTATIKLTAKDDSTITATLTITAQPLVAGLKDSKVSITPGAQADNVLNMTLAPETSFEAPKNGKLKYEVVVTPNYGTPKPKKLIQSAKTETLDVTAGSTSVDTAINVTSTGSGKLGEGEQGSFKVKAKLVYYAADGTTVLENSKTFEVKDEVDFSTIDGKAVVYEDNLKLQKAKSFKGTLYTGQEVSDGIAVADVSFKRSGAYDVIDYVASDDEITAVVKGKTLYVTKIAKNAFVGKHTLTVRAMADQETDHELHASEASITVNVKKGINQISVAPHSHKLYVKDAKGKTTMKMAAVLNGGKKDGEWYSDAITSSNGKKFVNVPAVKGLTWKLVAASGQASVPANIQAAVKVDEKNGTITVDNKLFKLSPDPKKNSFRVEVKPSEANYPGNPLAAVQSNDITLTNEGLDIGSMDVVFVTGVTDKKVIAKQSADKQEIEAGVNADEFDGAEVYVFPKSANVSKGEYTSAKWGRIVSKKIDSANYSIAVSNKKMAKMVDDTLVVLQGGKKLTLTITPKDGSKGKRKVVINLANEKLEGKELALKITAYSASAKESEFNKVVFDPTTANDKKKAGKVVSDLVIKKDDGITGTARLSYSVMKKNEDGDFEYADFFNDCKITVKNGKKFGSNGILTTKKVTEITMKAGKDTYKYTITNEAFELGKKYAITAANTLHQRGTRAEQTVTFNVKDGKANVAKDTQVRVELDPSAINAKNEDAMYTLGDMITNAQADNKIIVNDKGTATLNLLQKSDGLTGTESEFVELTPGSYKLLLTVGQPRTTKFVPVGDPVSVTIKVEKPKNFSFKPQSSYTLGDVDGSIYLTGKSNEGKGETRTVTFYNLQNNNVDGHKNDFTRFFVLDSETGRVRINTESEQAAQLLLGKALKDIKSTDEWKNADLTKLNTAENKKNLTGWVSWTAGVDKGYYNTREVSGSTKITIKINNKANKSVLKYGTNDVVINSIKGSKATVNVLVAGSYVEVAAAAEDKDAKVKAGDQSVNIVMDSANPSGTNAKGQVVLAVNPKGANLTLGKNNTAIITKNIKIIPAGSPYAAAYANAAKAEDKKNIIQTNGIPVKITITAKNLDTKANTSEAPDPITVGMAVSALYSENAPWYAEGYSPESVGAVSNGQVTITSNKSALASSAQTWLGDAQFGGKFAGMTASVCNQYDKANVGDGYGGKVAEIEFKVTKGNNTSFAYVWVPVTTTP